MTDADDDSTIHADFLQLFVGDVESPLAFASVQINAEMFSAHSVSVCTSDFLNLTEGEVVDSHINFSSDDNAQFEYLADLSAVNFFRID